MEIKTTEEWNAEYIAELEVYCGKPFSLGKSSADSITLFLEAVQTYHAARVLARVKHPDMNPIARKIFTRMTGVKLPGTIKGAMDVVNAWATESRSTLDGGI